MSFYEIYKPDYICRNLGLGAFEDLPAESHAVIRILYKPSFHPEACITILATGNIISFHAASFERESLWYTKGAKQLDVHSQQARVEQRDFNSFWDEVAELIRNPNSHGGVCIDGMGCNCFVRENGLKHVFEGSVFPGNTVHALATAAVILGWRLIHDKSSCDAFSNLGKYLGLQLPQKEIVPSVPRKQIAIFGTQEERDDLKDQINRKD